jgi:hypothetical protein
MVAWIVSLWILSISPPIKEWAHSPNAHTKRKRVLRKKGGERDWAQRDLYGSESWSSACRVEVVVVGGTEREEELGASRGFSRSNDEPRSVRCLHVSRTWLRQSSLSRERVTFLAQWFGTRISDYLLLETAPRSLSHSVTLQFVPVDSPQRFGYQNTCACCFHACWYHSCCSRMISNCRVLMFYCFESIWWWGIL